MHYLKVIQTVRQQTNEVLLFHSGTGKDSIMLLDLLSKTFDRVVCVFMYIVKDLDYENKYIRWAEKKYKNAEFIKTPHYAVYSFIKYGYLGMKKDSSQTKMKISKIGDKMKIVTGLEWQVFGFKKQDGITRRLMLNTYEDSISYKTKKAYPLADLTNSQVFEYIKDNNLIPPFNYGTLKPSSGCDISTPEFLAYIRDKYPADLQKIFAQYPFTEINLFKYDNRNEED